MSINSTYIGLFGAPGLRTKGHGKQKIGECRKSMPVQGAHASGGSGPDVVKATHISVSFHVVSSFVM